MINLSTRVSRRRLLIAFAAVFSCGCPAATDSGVTKADAVPVVLATVPMIGDVASEIGGETVAVKTLLKEGVDPHTYAPTSVDVRAITSADVVLYNGLLLEGIMQDTLERQNNSVAVASESIAAEDLRTPPGFAGHPDPHVWMDVARWRQIVPTVRDAIAAADEPNAAAYAERATALEARMTKLDDYVRQVLATIPEDRRKLVTAHDAFGYFAEAYAIEVFAVQGVSTESEAGVDDITRLVDLIVTEKIPAVFVENSVSNRNLEAVIEASKERGADVRVGGTLYSDSTGAPGTWEATYFGMIDHNVNTIAEALGGTVPEGGFRAWETDEDANASVRADD